MENAQAKGIVAKTLAVFQGNSGTEAFPGLQVSDMSGAEQSAVAEAKKRKGGNGGNVVTPQSGSGSVGSSGVAVGDGAVVINKLDLMAFLSEQNASTKQLLSQHTEQNSRTLATFGEGIQEKLEQFNCRVSNVETDTSEFKSEVKHMRELVAEVQIEQKRQADALLLANRKEGLSKADLDMDNFSRPPNLEIVQISSPKFVSIANVENAIKPYMESQQISSDIWNIVGNSQGKRFSMQFAQNAFTSAKLAQKVCKGLFNEGIDGAKGTWTELYADTAKPNRDGTFDQVKLFVGPDQTPEQRSTLFML